MKAIKEENFLDDLNPRIRQRKLNNKKSMYSIIFFTLHIKLVRKNSEMIGFINQLNINKKAPY